MPTKSGKFSAVNLISTLRQWSINDVSTPKAYVASNTQGGTGRRPGNVDWTGSLGAYGGFPAFMPNDTFAFKGYTAPTTGSEGPTYKGNVMVESVTVNWNWEAADILSHTMTFGSNGPLTHDVEAATVDSSAPNVPVVIGQQVYVTTDSSGPDEILQVKQVTLNVKSAVKTFVNSSTLGVTEREPGNIDWDATIVVDECDFAELPFVKGDQVVLKLPAGGELFWELEWGIVSGFQNLQVDRESSNIIGFTVHMEMSGFSDEDLSVGHIKLPGAESNWWPAS